jgi:hypothetical protein
MMTQPITRTNRKRTFDTARDEDCEAIVREKRVLAAKLDAAATQEEGAEARTQVRRLRNKRLADRLAIDSSAPLGASPRRAWSRRIAGTRR